MRFRRWPRPAPYEDTPRKRAAYLRKQHRERETLLLFAAMVRANQNDVDSEMPGGPNAGSRMSGTAASPAPRWREARARLFAFEPARRPGDPGSVAWLSLSADPSYLADLLHQIAIGKIDPERPPWIYHAKIAARITRCPATFEEAFRQIGHRKVGGGSKTNAADEYLWCGNLGSGLLFLTTRVRLNEPMESFYTSSAHRLRDSHVGRFGHWIDIVVRGDCSDAELATIERLAQAADTRRVSVRRYQPRGRSEPSGAEGTE